MNKEHRLIARGMVLVAVSVIVLFSDTPIPLLISNTVGLLFLGLGFLSFYYSTQEYDRRKKADEEYDILQQARKEKQTIGTYTQELKIELWRAQREYINALSQLPRHYLDKANVFTTMVIELLQGTASFFRIQATYVPEGGYYLLSQAVEVVGRITPQKDGRYALPPQHGLPDSSYRLAVRDITERLIAMELAYRVHPQGTAYLRGITPDEAFKALGLDVNTRSQFNSNVN